MRHPLLLMLGLLPKNVLSRLAGRFAGLPLPRFLRRPFLRAFGGTFGVDFAEVRDPLESFASLNHFFVRALADGARPVDPTPGVVVSPCDGAWGSSGVVKAGQLLQVKGRPYSLAELLGDPAEADRCEGGVFATLYLSPKDYHRFHLPCAARLEKATYLPGALWPVNNAGVQGVEGLFAVNERIVGFFDLAEPGFPAGRLAIAAVGATMVGKVKLVTEDLETNRGEQRADREYRPPRDFARGEEWGRFEFGSTLVLVAASGVLELEVAPPGTPLRLGRRIGRIPGASE
jgi:phosphatidylserine decarboxylase